MHMNLVRITALLAAFVIAGIATARTEPNSFLNRPAPTHGALMQQIRTDQQVMSRFMRHFGMTREEVISYFETLRLDTLKEDGVYLVYNVPDTEELRARAIFYKAGTKVWVDSQGTIVLKESCGNPMVRGSDTRSIAMVTPVEANVAPVRETTIVPQGTPTELLAATLPADVESSALAFPAAAPLAVSDVASSAAFNPAFLLPLAAVPLITSSESVDPIPEPMTMTILAGAAIAIAAKKRRKA